jgi:hypothetical protein
MTILRLCVALLCFVSIHVRAQEPLLPKPESQEPAATPLVGNSLPPVAAPSAPPQLMAPDVLSLSERSAPQPGTPNISLPEVEQSLVSTMESSAAENQRRQQEWRRLRNLVANDAEVKKAMLRADSARTDLEKRRLLRIYYDTYFAKITNLAAPEMKAYLADRKNEQLSALPQPRVRPETVEKKKPGG